MKFELNYEVDLSKPVLTRALNQPLFYSDSTAHELRITLKDDAFPEEASGYAYFVHLNNNVTERQELEFSEDRSVCYVTLPAIVYNTLGPISIVVQITEAGEKTTILALAAEVKPAKSGTVIDCSGIVLPDIDDILDRLEQAEQDVADITATVRTNVRQDNSADFLYKAFFGDDSDFSLTQYRHATVSKEGRLFTYTNQGTTGSTYYWVNLTGAAHRSFSGNENNALANIKQNDSDFINIPGFVRELLAYSSESSRRSFVIKMCMLLTNLTTSSNNNYVAIRSVFRKYNEETEDYTYSTIYTPGVLIDRNYIDDYGKIRFTTCPIAFSQAFNDQYGGRTSFGKYDQFAMYLQRRSQALAGEVILEPVLITEYNCPL